MRTLRWMTLVVLALAAGSAHARDDRQMFPLKDAFASPAAKEKLDPKVKMYFGKQATPAVARTIGNWKTNKKTNAMGKTEKEACEWAFLSAMLSLQERARKEGGDAVVHIESIYKDIPTKSETQYMCGVGNIMVGVAFRGDVVKLAH